MGRPPVGNVAKTAVVACRLTETEKKVLTARYGKPAIFLRRMIDEEMLRDREQDKANA